MRTMQPIRRFAGIALILCAAVALAGGCASKGAAKTATAAEARPVPSPTKPLRQEDFLTLHDGKVPDEIRNTVEIRNYRFEFTRLEELPEVRLEVFNKSDKKPLEFQIRTLFFREDGTVIDSSEWVTASAPERKSYRYRCLSFSRFAKSEQVQLRLLRQSDKPAQGN